MSDTEGERGGREWDRYILIAAIEKLQRDIKRVDDLEREIKRKRQ